MLKRLGLSEDATDEQVEAKLTSLGVEAAAEDTPSSPSPTQPPNDVTPSGDDTNPSAPAPAGDEEVTPSTGNVENPPGSQSGGPANAQQASGDTVNLDRETYNRLIAGAEAGTRAFNTMQSDEKERILAGAIGEGKFPPSRKEHWSQYWDRDPEGAKQAIASLEAGLVPISAATGNPSTPDGGAAGPSYPAGWLPEVAAKKAAIEENKGQLPRVMFQEG
jgi:hypothetical protein